jgi:hypothetical protein
MRVNPDGTIFRMKVSHNLNDDIDNLKSDIWKRTLRNEGF